jgi:hypothetical protein
VGFGYNNGVCEACSGGDGLKCPTSSTTAMLIVGGLVLTIGAGAAFYFNMGQISTVSSQMEMPEIDHIKNF